MTAPVGRYRAYGLTIESDCLLPELQATINDSLRVPDLRIVQRSLQGAMPSGYQLRIADFQQDRLYFVWRDLCRVAVEDEGRLVVVDAAVGADPALVSTVLLGPVMAAVLHWRGDALLHGSAVASEEGQVALFLGDNGAGKSSLAALCVTQGFALVNDDVAAVVPATAAARDRAIRTGFPVMKLSPVLVEGLAAFPGAPLPCRAAPNAKRRYRIDQHVEGTAPIGHIFLLERGNAVDLSRLSPAAAFAALMRHSYMAKFGTVPLSGDRGKVHFKACAALAQQVPASILTVPEGLDSLSAVPPVIAAVLADARQK